MVTIASLWMTAVAAWVWNEGKTEGDRMSGFVLFLFFTVLLLLSITP